MNFITLGSRMKSENLDKLIGLTSLSKDENGEREFLTRVDRLFRDRTQEAKDRIKEAGGYKMIFEAMDHYFNHPVSTVNYVTEGFFLLCKETDLFKIRKDVNNHRFKVENRYSEEYNSFAYPADFLFAYNLVSENNTLVEDLIRTPKGGKK